MYTSITHKSGNEFVAICSQNGTIAPYDRLTSPTTPRETSGHVYSSVLHSDANRFVTLYNATRERFSVIPEGLKNSNGITAKLVELGVDERRTGRVTECHCKSSSCLSERSSFGTAACNALAPFHPRWSRALFDQLPQLPLRKERTVLHTHYARQGGFGQARVECGVLAAIVTQRVLRQLLHTAVKQHDGILNRVRRERESDGWETTLMAEAKSKGAAYYTLTFSVRHQMSPRWHRPLASTER